MMDVSLVNFQPCESDSDMTCLKVPCYLGRMRRGDQVKIQMMSRLWQNTLIKVLDWSEKLRLSLLLLFCIFVFDSF